MNIKTVLSALNIDAEVIEQNVVTFATGVSTTIQSIEARLKAIEENQREILRFQQDHTQREILRLQNGTNGNSNHS